MTANPPKSQRILRKRPGSVDTTPTEAFIEKRRLGIERADRASTRTREMLDAYDAADRAPRVVPKRQAVSARPDMMGNRMWMLKTSDKVKRIFETPEDLRAAVLSYFDWNDTHPLADHKVVHHQGTLIPITTPKMRAMSKAALCLHIGINRSTWTNYGKREGYEDIVLGANEAIYTQKFEGACADLLNSSIIVRDLGLKDRTDVTSDDESISEVIRRVIE